MSNCWLFRGESPANGGRVDGESGYALTLTALLLIPLLAVTAIAVDIGVWYLQAQKNQRVADAAALAGAAWLPDQDVARDVAMDAARRNGLSPGVDSTVLVEFLGSSQMRVQVSTKSELSFSEFFLDDFSITRSSQAQFNPPVVLGSPESQLGGPTVDSAGVKQPAPFWLAISGQCASLESGDLYTARWRNVLNPTTHVRECDPWKSPMVANEHFNEAGYVFGVTVTQEWVDANPGEHVVIEAYDASYKLAAPDVELWFPKGSEFDTVFSLYDRGGDPHALKESDRLESRVVGTKVSAYTDKWATVATIVDPMPGTYHLQVSTPYVPGQNSRGSNSFALRVRSSGEAYRACSILDEPDCVHVAAIGALPMYAKLVDPDTPSDSKNPEVRSAEFWLAEIRGDHAGKILEIGLFDVGEYALAVEILDPNGDPVEFTWSIDCDGVDPPEPGGCSGGPTLSLDVSGTGKTQPYPRTYGTGRFNERLVTLAVPLPADYDIAYSQRWWKIRYSFGPDVQDRTTWTIHVKGDPIRLTG